MNSCTFSGKIYKIEDKGGKDSSQVMLRIGTRKPFVSEADKKANRYNIFMGMSAYGQQADFILKHFKKDDIIEVACQYDPYENKDGDEVPWFKVRDVNFPPGGSSVGGGDKDDDDKPARGRRNRDDDEDDKPARNSRRNRRDEDEDEGEEPPRRRRGRGGDAGGNSPF